MLGLDIANLSDWR